MSQSQGVLEGTDKAENADFHRKPLIFTDCPFLQENKAFLGCTAPQKAEDSHSKLQGTTD